MRIVLFVVLSVIGGVLPAQQLRVTQQKGEILVQYGPLDFPARTTHRDMPQPPALVFTLPADGWMRGYAVELVDGAGRAVPKRLLHHMNVIAPDKRDLFSNAMLRVGAAGAETSDIRLPRVLGFRGRKGDSLVVTLMFHNPTDTAWRDVTLRARVPFTPASSAVGAVTIYPLSVAIGPKDKPNVFDLPPGRSEHYWEGSPAVAGRVLGLSGHLHKYGVALRLEDRTTGTVLWEATPQRDAHGEITGMPVSRFLLSAGKPLRPDRVYRLTALYDNPTGRTIPEGGMGVMGGVLMLRGASRWPAIDPANADYLKDRAQIFGAAGHHGH
jgi:hypothetical protein